MAVASVHLFVREIGGQFWWQVTTLDENHWSLTEGQLEKTQACISPTSWEW